MDQPCYILKAYEGIRKPKNDTLVLYYTKKALWIIILTLLEGSIIFKDNLFTGLSFSAQVALVCAFLRIRALTKEEFVASPFEIWFYSEYVVIYREKYYYNIKLSRKQYDKFYYKDIRDCVYHTVSQRVDIFGIVEGIWYDYDKNDTVSGQPTYHKTTDSIRYFYTNMAPEIDFVGELKAHMPVKVTIHDN